MNATMKIAQPRSLSPKVLRTELLVLWPPTKSWSALIGADSAVTTAAADCRCCCEMVELHSKKGNLHIEVGTCRSTVL